MSNCTCGRTTRPPLCDGSHSLSESQYKERTEKLAELINNSYNDPMKNENPEILANKIQTPDGTILQSFNRHDYKSYKDKNGHTYIVDGGCDYLRRNSLKEATYKELSVYSNDPHELIRESMHWGTRGLDGQSFKYVSLKEMTTEHIQACLDTQYSMRSAFRKAMQDELNFRKNQ